MANVHPGPIVRHLHRVAGAAATDTQLLERFLAGREEEAFAQLVRRHGPMVWGVCRHRTRRDHDAEDAFQAVFLVLAQRGSAIKKRAAVASWLHGVAYRMARKANRRQEQRQARERRAARAEEVPGPDLAWPGVAGAPGRGAAGAAGEVPRAVRPVLPGGAAAEGCGEGTGRAGGDGVEPHRAGQGAPSGSPRQARRDLVGGPPCRRIVAAVGGRGGAPGADTRGGRQRDRRRPLGGGAGPGLRRGDVGRGACRGWRAGGAGGADGGRDRVRAAGEGRRPGRSEAGGRCPRRPAAGGRAGAAGDGAVPAGQPPELPGVHPRWQAGRVVRRLERHRRVGRGDRPRGRQAAAALERNPCWARLAKDGRTVYTLEYENAGRQVSSDGTSNSVVRARRLTDLQEVTKGFNVGPLEVLGLSPDGKHLLGEVRQMNKEDEPHALEIWDVQAGRKVRSWPAHQGQILAWAFTADGTTLATGGEDKVIRFWDVATGAKRFEIADHPDTVGLLALSADGTTLASVGITRTVHPNGSSSRAARKQIVLWDVPTRKVRHRLDTPGWVSYGTFTAGQPGVYFAPDGKTLVSPDSGGKVRLWDVTTGKQVREIAHGEKTAMANALSPDGKALALGYNDIRVVSVADGKDLQRFDGPRTAVQTALPLGDGRTVVAAGDGFVIHWDRLTGRQRRRVFDRDKVGWPQRVLPDGRTLYCVNDNWTPANYTTTIWDLNTGKAIRTFEFMEDPIPPTPPGVVIQRFPPPPKHSGRYTARVSPDGRLIAYGNQSANAASLQGFLALHDTETGKAVRRVENLGGDPSLVAFSPDSRMLTWAVRNDTTVHVLEVASGKERKAFAGHRGRIHSLEFAVDGRTLVTASEDTTAVVWDVLGGGEAVPLGPKELDAAWVDLADADAATAFRAMRRLAVCPDTVAVLRKRLAPVPAVAEARLAKLIADLDSDTAADRERASRALEQLGDVAADACRRALAEKPAAEPRRRLERLLAALDAQVERPTGDRLRLIRSVEVLERFSTPEAAALLKALAGGAPAALLTREASDAVGRRKGR